jgi:hypothetical protein
VYYLEAYQLSSHHEEKFEFLKKTMIIKMSAIERERELSKQFRVAPAVI